MNEALRKGLNDRMEIANQKAQNTIDKGKNNAQLITQAFNGATEVAQQAIGTYAQSQMRKDAPTLRKGLRELADKYSDPDNPNAYNDYLDARKNYIDDYLKDKNVLFKGMFSSQFRASFEDDAYEYFDEKITSTIAERNKMNATEAMQNALNSAMAGEDLSIYDNTSVFKTTVDKDGIHVVSEEVKLKDAWDTSLPTDTDDALTNTNNEKKNNFNHLLNIYYANACTLMPTDKAKNWVNEQIPSIESDLIKGDIAYMSEQEVLRAGLSEQQAITNVQKMFGPITDNPEDAYATPYTGRKMSASEISSYREIAESYVKNAWANKQIENIALYNDKVLPALEEYEANGGYVTTDVFNDAINGAGIEDRFIKSITSQWNPILQTNDAMEGLKQWFEEGQPMSKELTAFQNQYVYTDEHGDTKYTNDAGYLLSSGLKDKTAQMRHNAEVEAKRGRQALALSIEGESYQSEAIGIQSSNIAYRRNDGFTVGANMVIEKTIDSTLARLGEAGIDFSIVNNMYTDDPYQRGLTESQINRAKKYSEENNVPYVRALIELGLYNGQDAYDLGYDFISNLLSVETGENNKDNLEFATQDACTKERYNWRQDFAKRYQDYENRVDEYYGNKTSLTDVERMDEEAKRLGLDSANGNININQFFEEARNEDGSVSTVNTISINEDGKEVLIPTTWSGKNHTEQEAIDRYHDTGLNFGSFESVEDANTYAENLHKFEEWKEDNKIGLVHYVASSPSSRGSSSSSSKITSVTTYGGVENILKWADGEINSATQYALYPESSVAGVFTGLMNMFGTEDDNGHIIDMSDLRMLAQSYMLTKEERDTINKMGAGELAKVLFEGSRFKEIVSIINNNAYSEKKAEQYLIATINFLDKNHANNDNIDSLMQTISDEIKNGAQRDFYDDLMKHGSTLGFTDGANSFNRDFNELIKGYANNRITQEDSTAKIIGNNKFVEDIINKGLSGTWSDQIPQSFLSLFANKDIANIWNDEDKVIRACLEGAFYFTGNQTEFNANTDIKSFKNDCSQIFDTDGDLKRTSTALSKAEQLYENFEIAGELYAVAYALHKLNDPSLNLGEVESISGNEFKMSNGPTVVISTNPKGGFNLQVRNIDGVTFEDVNTCASNKMLEKYSTDKSNQLNNREDYYNASITASGRRYPKYVYSSSPDAVEEQKKAYRSLSMMGQEFSNNIDYSDNPKITDGQFDKEWAKAWGFDEDKIPTLYNGWSMNGYRYNYRITTDANATYNWEPPKDITAKEAVTGAVKTWWSELWKGLAGLGTNYTIMGAKNKDSINEFTNKLFGE